MGWEYNKAADTAARKGVARKAKKSTGVKHIRPTISGFAHPDPDKAESMLTRLNLRSNDPLSSGGGSGNSLTAGEIFAALGMGKARVPRVERLVGMAVTSGSNPHVTAGAIADLAYYKHTGNRESWRGIYSAALQLLVSIAVEEGWADAKKDERDRGIMTSCAITAIEDVCAPAPFIGKTMREWSALLGLENHKQWDRKWAARYQHLRGLIQELDMAADEQIRRRV